MSQWMRESWGRDGSKQGWLRFRSFRSQCWQCAAHFFIHSPLMLYVLSVPVFVDMFPAQQQWRGNVCVCKGLEDMNGRMLSVQLSVCCIENGHQSLPPTPFPFHVLFVLTLWSNWRQLQKRASHIKEKGKWRMGKNPNWKEDWIVFPSVIQYSRSLIYSVFMEMPLSFYLPPPSLPCFLYLFAIAYWPWIWPPLYQSSRSIWNGQDDGS
jgi:hypothetical protein